jgi:cytochrome c551
MIDLYWQKGHGVDFEGGVGPNLQKVGRRLSAQQIVEVLTNSRGIMPACKGELPEEQIEIVAGWLARLK